MDKRKAITKILTSVQKKTQVELSALLGHQLEFHSSALRESTREELFDGLEKKQVFAEIRVEGEREGTAYLIANVPDALMLGGTLIMLPETELQERVERGEFSDEDGDAFGEIVNIWAGVLTAQFGDIYPDKIRFVKYGHQTIDPLKASAQEEYPLPEGRLLISSAKLKIDDGQLPGSFQLIIPLDIFALEEPAEPPVAEPVATVVKSPQPEVEPAPVEAKSQSAQVVSEHAQAPSAPEPAKGGIDEKRFKKILKAIHGKIQEEVGGFLGQEVEVSKESFSLVRQDEFFEGKELKQVLTKMRVEGDHSGEAYILINLRSAICLGGTLIMLPPNELEERLNNQELAEEDGDAYGEITNIIAGIYTAVFDDLYPGHLRFVKTEQKVVDPLRISATEEYPFPEPDLYRVAGKLTMGGEDLGLLEVALPISLLQVTFQEAEVAPAQTQPSGVQEVSANSGVSKAPLAPMVMVFTDDPGAAEAFVSALHGLELAGQVCRLQDDARGILHEGSVRGVVLVMGDVREQGIAAAIKIRSSLPKNLPMIAAGPNWTRSMVLRAVKYGIRDILVTPADEAQIQEKIRANVSP